MNCWMRTGVFSARKVRRFCGDNRKVSRLARGIPFFDSSLAFKGKAATLLETPGNYTDLPLWCKEISEEVSARDDGIPSGAKAHFTLIGWMYGLKPVPFNTAGCTGRSPYLSIPLFRGSLGQDHQLGLAAAAHAVNSARVERTRIVLVAAGVLSFYGNWLASAADDGIVGVKRRVSSKRDHESSVLARRHPNDGGAGLNAKELVVLCVRNS